MRIIIRLIAQYRVLISFSLDQWSPTWCQGQVGEGNSFVCNLDPVHTQMKLRSSRDLIPNKPLTGAGPWTEIGTPALDGKQNLSYLSLILDYKKELGTAQSALQDSVVIDNLNKSSSFLMKLLSDLVYLVWLMMEDIL